MELKQHERFDKFNPSKHMRDEKTGKNNSVRKVILDKILSLPITSILDAPIGTGTDYELFKETEFFIHINYYGLDFNINALDFCETLGIHKDNLFYKRITDTGLEDNFFDLVYSKDIIEHLDGDEYKQCIAEMLRIAKKYFILVMFKGGFDRKSKIINSADFIEQEYTREEIENCFGDLPFIREEHHSNEDGNTYIIYLVKK